MRRHVIVGRYGPGDHDSVAIGSDELETRIQFADGNLTLGHGIGQAIRDLARMGVYPSEMGADLLLLAAHVQLADTRLSRRTESQDGWTREIRLVVPVAEPERWQASASLFERMLKFLTGDLWSIGFRSRPNGFSRVTPDRPASVAGCQVSDLALFSGGLDSLIGAIDSLATGRSPLLLSHASEGATSQAQSSLFKALSDFYPESPLRRLRLWMKFARNIVAGSRGEPTMRGRSFLFFALGVFAGSGFQERFELYVPENGLIAINVPLDPLRLGALSTRTTHPFYIARWNEALGVLGLNGRIVNPYWNKTKGEMVRDCANQSLLSQLAAQSLSCASPTKGRWRGHGIQHCGYCLPCLIRRASLENGLGAGADPTAYTVADLADRVLNTRASEGLQVRSFQMAIERIRAQPALARVLIHKPGPLYDETPERKAELAAVYRRGLDEVDAILHGVRAEPA